MKSTKQTDSNYFIWLRNLVNYNNHREFGFLLRGLNSLLFYSTVNYDDNRALDGLALRDTYHAETGRIPPDGECTVLEMLIALAERMAYTLYDAHNEIEDQVPIWFWMLLDNLRIDPLEHYDKNIQKVENWLARKYAADGSGGLFPLRYPQKDQRKEEIWYQMQAYLNEFKY